MITRRVWGCGSSVVSSCSSPIVRCASVPFFRGRRWKVPDALCRAPRQPIRSFSDLQDKGEDQVAATPGQLPKEISPLPLLKSLWPREVGHNVTIVFAMSGLLAGKALAIWAPLQLGHLVDALGGDVQTLPLGLLAGYGLARLSSSAFNELRQALFASVSQALCRALARRSFEHLHTLDVSYLISNKPGALSVVVMRATKSLQQVLSMLLFNVFPIAVEFTMALCVMGTIAGFDCVVATTVTLFSYAMFTTRYSNNRRVIMRRANKAEEDASGVFSDSLTNCELVKLFQNEKLEARRYDDALKRYEESQVKVLRSLAVLNFSQQCIVATGFTAILGLTASRVITGDLPVGEVVAIHAILAQLMQPLGILGGVYRVTTQGFIDLGKLAGFLRLASSTNPVGGGVPFQFRGGHIEFRNVHFSHVPGTPVLSGANLTVEPGTKVAVVGASGTGKSTLLKLLYRLVDPQHGQVLIDGQDIKNLSVDSFRKHLGIVPQDGTLFNETIAFNIRFGRPGATEKEVQEAAQQAQVHDLIMSLPDGYNTTVGERGLKLSGGERQRIGLARCFLRNPSIVLLDEATSALDVQTERNLAEEVDELARGRTCVIVAHRLSTVQRCDVVAFFVDGSVRERGSHEELMERSGAYRMFWEGSAIGA